MTETHALSARIAQHGWYHTLELAPGVFTPGWFDLRDQADDILRGVSLAGKRCLDVGTFDGFWAFEMERRGARETIAIDILDPAGWDWPVGSGDDVARELDVRKAGGSGFLLAREQLGSAVERLEMSVYDLDPDAVGTFDFVYVGSLLLHLRDPVRALASVRSVCRGNALVVDAIDLAPTLLGRRLSVASLYGVGRPWWWKPSLAALEQMVRAAGFDLLESARRVNLRNGAGALPAGGARRSSRRLLAAARALGVVEGRDAWVARRRGDPHGVVHARPCGRGG